jgi:nicotinate-nucleotide adenylyltransferase
VRLGLFGGTFDPPHTGHLLAASDAHELLQLDRTVLIPNAAQPLKTATPVASAADRLAMVRLLCEGDARFTVDSLEVDRGGLSFTVDTLREFHRRYPGAALFLLVGEDVEATLPSWRESTAIPGLATVVILTRSTDPERAPGMALPDRVDGLSAAGFMRISTRRVDVSASEVRARAAAGLSLRGFVTDQVKRYIEDRRLYGGRTHGREDA